MFSLEKWLCRVGCVIKSKNEVWERALWNQVVLLYKETGSKEKNWIFDFLPTPFFTWKIPGPLYNWKKKSSDYRLHGTQNDRLELTVSTQKSVLKNMYWVPRYYQKVSKIGLPNQTSKILHILADISGLGAYFQNRFLRCNRESEPVDLNTINPIIRTIFFSRIKGSDIFLKLRAPKLNPLNCQPTLLCMCVSSKLGIDLCD